MFNNMFSENCFCTLKEIQVGSHEFSWNRKKLLQIVSHDLWAWNQKIVIHGIWNPRACIHEDGEKVKLNRKKYSERIIMSFKQRKIKFKPRKKLKHNIYTVQNTFHVVLCLLSTYWDIHHFGRLFISNLSKMLKFAATHGKMTNKTKHQLISKGVW